MLPGNERPVLFCSPELPHTMKKKPRRKNQPGGRFEVSPFSPLNAVEADCFAVVASFAPVVTS
jgi:hypothetical protein